MNSVYIGIDLAWGEKNLSGFCVLLKEKNRLKILDLKLLKTIEEIIDELKKYDQYKIFLGIDAPLIIPNETANREIEKQFNKDFSKYKISMLPVNKKILTKYTQTIRSEELFFKLTDLGYKRDYKSDKVIFEVYPHATIAICFNNHNILPYKRKKGRSVSFIKEQLLQYKKFLQKEILSYDIFKEDILTYRGQKLKDYEDKLDAITCAFTMSYCQNNERRFYKLDGVDTFVTPISKWRVYILRCSDDTLYTGITTNLQKRLYEHNNSKLGAKYTKVRRPVELVYWQNADDRVDASKKEYAIKQLSRKEKLRLINV